jgi:hypothetical protein
MASHYLPKKALHLAPVNERICGASSGDVRERAQRANDAGHGRAADDGLPGLPRHAAPGVLRQHGAPAAAASAASAASVAPASQQCTPSLRHLSASTGLPCTCWLKAGCVL